MIIIGITGLSCSGKTTLSKNLQNYLGKEQCLLISTDDYYKELTEEQYKVLHNDSAEINFDTPERIDFSLLKNNLKDIKNNNPVEIPKVKVFTYYLNQTRLNLFKLVRFGKLFDYILAAYTS